MWICENGGVKDEDRVQNVEGRRWDSSACRGEARGLQTGSRTGSQDLQCDSLLSKAVVRRIARQGEGGAQDLRYLRIFTIFTEVPEISIEELRKGDPGGVKPTRNWSLSDCQPALQVDTTCSDQCNGELATVDGDYRRKAQIVLVCESCCGWPLLPSHSRAPAEIRTRRQRSGSCTARGIALTFPA